MRWLKCIESILPDGDRPSDFLLGLLKVAVGSVYVTLLLSWCNLWMLGLSYIILLFSSAIDAEPCIDGDAFSDR